VGGRLVTIKAITTTPNSHDERTTVAYCIACAEYSVSQTLLLLLSHERDAASQLEQAASLQRALRGP